MDYAFRPFRRNDPPAPAPGELHLRPRSASPQAGRRLACLAVDEGPEAFVRGEGPVRCLVLQADPTLDDMLAALFVERLLTGKELPPGAKAFATYAALAREGLKPGDLPLPDSLAGVYLAVRREAGGDLAEDGPRAQFLADWSELARRVMEAAEAGWNPFSRALVADDPTFARARAFLAKDRDVYVHQDVCCGERWLMMLPGGPKQPVGGLLLGSPPKSILWKYWAREDPDAPGGRGYLFLAVYEDRRHWRFSTDPVHRLSIRSLADKLQRAEAARDAVRAAADPWFDGAPFGHTIIGAPRGGTLLSDAEVLAIVKRWAGVRPAVAPGAVPARTRLPVTAASLVLGCAGLAALTWSLAGHRPDRAGPVPPLPAPAMLVRVNAGPQVRALIVEDETKARETAQADLNFQPGLNQAVFSTSRRVSEPVKLRVTLRFPEKEVPLEAVRVEVNGKESPPLSFEPGSGKERRSHEVGAFFNGGGENLVIVKAENTRQERVRVIVELGWEADLSFKRDLHLLAVGVSRYQDPHLELRYAAADARGFVDVLKRQQGQLFEKVVPTSLTDKQVRKGDLVDHLVRLSKDVTPESLVLVTVSGHGKKVRTTNRYFFLPYDYDPAKPPNDRGVSWQDFQDCLTGFPCPVVLVLDTCHSGAAGGGGLRGGEEVSISPEELERAVREAAELWKGNRSGIVVMAACLGEEVAHEDARWGHGALTLALLEGIQGKRLYTDKQRTPLPQESAGPVITLQDLQDYATKRVKELAGNDQAVVVRCTDGVHPARIPIAVNLAAGPR